MPESLRILIADTYYPAFTHQLYERAPDLAALPFAEQRDGLMAYCFGTADFYSANLRLLGHDAQDLILNCDPLQLRWAEAHAPALARDYPERRGERALRRWQHALFAEQVAQIQPDVLYIQDISWTDTWCLRALRRHTRLIVGQIAAPFPRLLDLRPYDLLLSSFPHYVTRFRARGAASEYLRLAFEQRILERLPDRDPQYDIVFVGGVSAAHRAGIQVLEAVARSTPVDFWGYGSQTLPVGSPIRRQHHGEAWGLEMYRVLSQARVALNRHIGVAENYANNMRLYEATGMGVCLLTDRKDNLADLFEPDREVAVYSSAAECAERARYLIEHEAERQAIARAGQQRTLREHTYQHRMQELSDLLDRYLRRGEQRARRHFSVAGLTHQARAIADAAQTTIGALVGRTPASYGYRPLAEQEITGALVDGWRSEAIPVRQRAVASAELRRMHAGGRVPVYDVAAAAVRATGMVDPQIIEIGCASAYYSEALSFLLGYPVRYIGVDYSAALLAEGRRHYPGLPLLAADATAIPVADQACDVVFSAALLMHVPDYRRAVHESARLARSWCIFHRTPVVLALPTRRYTKYAYDVPVVELVFNEEELLSLFTAAQLEVVREFPLDGFLLPEAGQSAGMKTYVCRKIRSS